MLEAGGFQNTVPRTVSNLAYWKLGGGDVAGDIKGRKGDASQLMLAAKQGLENLLTAFGRLETPYLAVPIPHFMPRYDDYAHLARISEWGRVDEDPE
jgi:ATP-dependent helicase/nuclease subunit B